MRKSSSSSSCQSQETPPPSLSLADGDGAFNRSGHHGFRDLGHHGSRCIASARPRRPACLASDRGTDDAQNGTSYLPAISDPARGIADTSAAVPCRAKLCSIALARRSRSLLPVSCESRTNRWASLPRRRTNSSARTSNAALRTAQGRCSAIAVDPVSGSASELALRRCEALVRCRFLRLAISPTFASCASIVGSDAISSRAD
jgi:hypothetical protein